MTEDKYQAGMVLERVNEVIDTLNSWEFNCVDLDDIFIILNIFDWWQDEMSVQDLIKMREFLEEAIKLGFKGYVCFNYGGDTLAQGGMWANVEESETRTTSVFLYRTFSTDCEYWKVYTHNMPNVDCTDKNILKECKASGRFTTIKELETYFYNNKKQ